MNPNAKEFVPAHILKKRQEEADLAKQLNQVELSNGETSSGSGDAVTNIDNNDKQQQTTTTTTNESKNVQDNSTKNDEKSSPIDNNDNKHDDKGVQNPQSNGLENHNHLNNNNNDQNQNQERQQNNHNNNHDLANNDDDSHLLNAGENFCEFNGEQFIIPASDDEYEDEPCPEEHHPRPGYDFGNAEDNDDEDVCNAYEQFLESLPDQ